jgi:hypothetical protein
VLSRIYAVFKVQFAAFYLRVVAVVSGASFPTGDSTAIIRAN